MLLRPDDRGISTEHRAKELNRMWIIVNLQIFRPIDALGQRSSSNIAATILAQALATDVYGGTA